MEGFDEAPRARGWNMLEPLQAWSPQNGWFYKLGGSWFVGLLAIRALLLGVYIWASDIWKLPNGRGARLPFKHRVCVIWYVFSKYSSQLLAL